MMAESAKRDVSTFEPRIEKALSTQSQVNKAFHEITQLEGNMKIEGEKTQNFFEAMETNMQILEGKS